MLGALLGSVLLAASATAPAETPAKLAGLYEIHQMEMGGGLELQPDGHFRYALEYGAVSEEGEGKWAVEDGVVRLTSNPRPKAPDFELVKDEPAPAGELFVTLEPPGFGWRGRLDLVATIAGLLVGYPCFRMRITGHYFALLTLAFTEFIRLCIIGLRDWTGGSLGTQPARASLPYSPAA